MMKSLLIANRSEIACRVIRTARDLGVHTIAVYSDADAKAPHVQLADEAVHIGPSPANESYLVGEKIIAAAMKTSADAIHPGYGFLSENADFAQAVMDAGMIWVGPKPDSIRAMGLKDAAKKLMMDAGVPTTPGYLGQDQSPETLKKEADQIGYPVLIKAVAGGGGKGMRKVDAEADFLDALASCQREAKASFGETRVLLEKWITNPRHIEVQVFGDTHGNIVHLFERDCTLQRRHQKVIEEAPAPGMDEATRYAICGAAVRAAQAVDYVGAGTIEFIADGSGGLSADTIWFMEMNTRLQVEHPVTELVTGVDLVEWQLRIASGEQLPMVQEDLSIDGWAMEARLYAENPATGFLPSTGRLDLLELPVDIRVDSGVEEGGEVSPFYDPMIAKLITYGETRDDARLDLAEACDGVSTWPVHNNAGFLASLLRADAFAEGEVTTGYIEAHLDALTVKPLPGGATLTYAAELLFEDMSADDTAPANELIWSVLKGFRSCGPDDDEVRIRLDGDNIAVNTRDLSGGADLMVAYDKHVIAVERGWPYLIEAQVHTSGAGADAASDGAILSPMPGKVISVDVATGDAVKKGQKLATLEAMKMEHALTAPFDGVVAELSSVAGDQVSEGQRLMKIEKPEETN